jgi:hypothetical protein
MTFTGSTFGFSSCLHEKTQTHNISAINNCFDCIM